MTGRIAIAGASGFIGRALTSHLAGRGIEVLRLVRRRPRKPGETQWDPETGVVDGSALDGVQAMIALGGTPIAVRWTPTRKLAIRRSRVAGTHLLAATAAGLPNPPATFLAASAIGYYGDRGDQVLTESDAAGEGFAADVAHAWEGAARPAVDAGIRTVALRFGLVLGPDGGALARMLPAFRIGLGGQLGSGRQWMSWITLRDTVRAIEAVVAQPEWRGPVNVVAPNPVTNAEFTRTLASALRRPAVLAVPPFALRLLFGEMADETLLSSTRAVPERLLRGGFTFEDPDLGPALRGLLAPR